MLMKNFIKRFFYFLFFLFFSYIILLILFGNYNLKELNKNMNYRIGGYGHMHSRITEINNFENIDVLILGSSHAYRGFDPRIFKEQNITLFNLGSNIQTPTQTKFLLERYLDKINPQIVLFEVFPDAFISDGVESTLDIVSNDIIKSDMIRIVTDLNHLKVYNTFIYAMYRQIFKLDDSFIEQNKKNGDVYISGGYVQRIDSKKIKDVSLKKRKINFLDYQENALNEIIQLLNSKNIKLILIQAPVTKLYYQTISNNAAIDTYFNCTAEYYNFNKLMNLSDDYFYDSNHLNQEGVLEFNNMLIEKLFSEELRYE